MAIIQSLNILGWVKTKTVGARVLPEGIEVTFASAQEGEAGGNASVAAPVPQAYDMVLQAVGRTPNGKKIAADKAGVAVTERGFISVDIQMRTDLAHKAVHEAHVVAEVIAGELQGNKELASAAYTDPEVAWVGLILRPGESAGHQGQEGPVPVDRLRARHCQRPRRRRHQAAV